MTFTQAIISILKNDSDSCGVLFDVALLSYQMYAFFFTQWLSDWTNLKNKQNNRMLNIYVCRWLSPGHGKFPSRSDYFACSTLGLGVWPLDIDLYINWRRACPSVCEMSKNTPGQTAGHTRAHSTVHSYPVSKPPNNAPVDWAGKCSLRRHCFDFLIKLHKIAKDEGSTSSSR